MTEHVAMRRRDEGMPSDARLNFYPPPTDEEKLRFFLREQRNLTHAAGVLQSEVNGTRDPNTPLPRLIIVFPNIDPDVDDRNLTAEDLPWVSRLTGYAVRNAAYAVTAYKELTQQG